MTQLNFTETKIDKIEILGENYNTYEIEGRLIEEDYDDGCEVFGILRKNGKEVSKFSAALDERVTFDSVNPKWTKDDKHEFIRAANEAIDEVKGRAATFLFRLIDGLAEGGG